MRAIPASKINPAWPMCPTCEGLTVDIDGLPCDRCDGVGVIDPDKLRHDAALADAVDLAVAAKERMVVV